MKSALPSFTRLPPLHFGHLDIVKEHGDPMAVLHKPLDNLEHCNLMGRV
jgi:hypothetical protein